MVGSPNPATAIGLKPNACENTIPLLQVSITAANILPKLIPIIRLANPVWDGSDSRMDPPGSAAGGNAVSVI